MAALIRSVGSTRLPPFSRQTLAYEAPLRAWLMGLSNSFAISDYQQVQSRALCRTSGENTVPDLRIQYRSTCSALVFRFGNRWRPRGEACQQS